MLKTLGEADALIPTGLGPTYGGAWVGWYVRALLTPFVGYKNAQYVVARALGPGFDFEAPHHHEATVTVPRGKRGKQRKRATSAKAALQGRPLCRTRA